MNNPGPSHLMASLYVGDLHPDVTEAMLFDKFSTVGPVLSVRVCYHIMTGCSLGYAYVNFQHQADAELALDTMNFDTVNGRPIRIMWSQRDPSVRKSGVGNVFIKNLNKNIDNKALYNTFSVFGNISSCKIACDDKGSKGYGFLHFETEKAANQAIDKVNGKLLNGKKVYLGHFIPSKERIKMIGDKKKTFNNVYVKNFADQLDDEKLRNMFNKYGKIISAIVMMNEEGKSLGFGFVCFEEPESAEKAVDAINGREHGGRVIYCGKAQKRAERQAELKEQFEKIKMERINQGVNLYVKYLDNSIDDERLRKEFSKFGTITSAKVVMEGGRSKGFGFVCFSSPEEATKAVTEMNGRIIVAQPLYVALAQRKEDRRAQLASRYMQKMANLHQQQPAQYSQMFQMAPGNYFIPAIAQSAQNRFYAPQLVPMRTNPGWNTSVRPTQQTAGFQGMPPAQMQQKAPTQTAAARTALNAQPITGQATVSPKAGGQPGPRPMAPGISRPSASVQTGPAAQQSRLKYIPNLRNTPMAAQPGVQEPLTASMVADAPPQEQKEMLGERLFPLIQQMYPELVPERVGKITGMLLEMENYELMHLLESQDSLKAKVKEAVAVLNAHQAKEAAAAQAAPVVKEK